MKSEKGWFIRIAIESEVLEIISIRLSILLTDQIGQECLKD